MPLDEVVNHLGVEHHLDGASVVLALLDASVEERLRLVDPGKHLVVDYLEVAPQLPAGLREVSVLPLKGFPHERNVPLVLAELLLELDDCSLSLLDAAAELSLDPERLRPHLLRRCTDENLDVSVHILLELRILLQDPVLIGDHQVVSPVDLLDERRDLGLDVLSLGRHELHQLAA